MLVLGAVTIASGFGLTPGALVGAAGCLAYGIAGAVWIVIFVCPYCGHSDSLGCS